MYPMNNLWSSVVQIILSTLDLIDEDPNGILYARMIEFDGFLQVLGSCHEHLAGFRHRDDQTFMNVSECIRIQRQVSLNLAMIVCQILRDFVHLLRQVQ